MEYRRSLIILITLAVLSFPLIAPADAPPETAHERISQNLVIESGGEFTGYRFFIKSGPDLRELHVSKGERLTIEPLGDGPEHRVGTLIAVPVNALVGFSEGQNDGSRLSELQSSLHSGNVAGAIELLTHVFVPDLGVSGSRGAAEAVYRIETDREKGIKAVAISGGGPNGGRTPDFNIYSNEAKTPLFWAAVAGTSLLTLALISLGVWLVRRSRIA